MARFTPDASQLNGLSVEDAEKFGKPHIMAHSTGFSSGSVDSGASCICGAPATNAHHIKPKGMGGGSTTFTMRTKLGTFELKSALVAVCGSGNASGCHGRLHSGDIRIKWVWNSDEDARDWWSGKLLSRVGNAPHGKWLYEHGRWETVGFRPKMAYDGVWHQSDMGQAGFSKYHDRMVRADMPPAPIADDERRRIARSMRVPDDTDLLDAGPVAKKLNRWIESGLTKTTISRASGVSTTFISEIANGKKHRVSRRVKDSIVEAGRYYGWS